MLDLHEIGLNIFLEAEGKEKPGKKKTEQSRRIIFMDNKLISKLMTI